MIPIVRYASQEKQMGELLAAHDVSLKSDLSEQEYLELREILEQYLTNGKLWNESIQLNLKKFCLILCGPDEVSFLYEYCK